MSIYLSIPSLVAMPLVFWFAKISAKNKNFSMLAFCLGSIGMLSAEVTFYLSNLTVDDSLLYKIVVLYYISVIVCSAAFIFSALQVGKLINRKFIVVILMFSLLNVILFVMPGMALLGIQTISYGYTRIAGPYYWVFQVTTVGFLLTGMLILVYATRKFESWIVRRKALVLLTGSVFLVVSAIAIVLMMQLGLKINGLVWGPTAICMFISILIYSEYEQKMFKLLSLLPSSPEQRLTRSTISALLKYKSGNLQAAINEFERAVIADTLEKCRDNKTLAAEMLGISRATLRRKLEAEEK